MDFIDTHLSVLFSGTPCLSLTSEMWTRLQHVQCWPLLRKHIPSTHMNKPRSGLYTTAYNPRHTVCNSYAMLWLISKLRLSPLMTSQPWLTMLLFGDSTMGLRDKG